MSKVGHWLSEQHDPSSGKYDQTLKQVTTWDLIYINTKEKVVNLSNSFSILESEAIGISCYEKPSVSVMYPNTDKATVILSDSKMYRSATFVKVSGKEYLAAASFDDGCLYLWDVESKTSKQVFDPKLPEDQNDKGMNICKIDENTTGYGEARTFPLTEAEESSSSRPMQKKITLSSTLRLFTSGTIFDMCYTEVDGGTPCLLLCIPNNNHIMAVEMVGGKTRWEVGKEQMGEKFKPYSICTDEDNTIYVADFGQNKIHLLSAEDGFRLSDLLIPIAME